MILCFFQHQFHTRSILSSISFNRSATVLGQVKNMFEIEGMLLFLDTDCMADPDILSFFHHLIEFLFQSKKNHLHHFFDDCFRSIRVIKITPLDGNFHLHSSLASSAITLFHYITLNYASQTDKLASQN